MKLTLQEQRLNKLVVTIGAIKDDEELKSHLSKYFCILVSGYVENYIKELVLNYHEGTCKKESAKFIYSKIRSLTNLDDAKIVDFLKLFSDNWADGYLSSRSDEMETAFNSVYAQRNKIAHGDASNSNISYNSISQYYETIKEAMVLLSIIISK